MSATRVFLQVLVAAWAICSTLPVYAQHQQRINQLVGKKNDTQDGAMQVAIKALTAAKGLEANLEALRQQSLDRIQMIKDLNTGNNEFYTAEDGSDLYVVCDNYLKDFDNLLSAIQGLPKDLDATGLEKFAAQVAEIKGRAMHLALETAIDNKFGSGTFAKRLNDPNFVSLLDFCKQNCP